MLIMKFVFYFYNGNGLLPTGNFLFYAYLYTCRHKKEKLSPFLISAYFWNLFSYFPVRLWSLGCA